MRSAADILPAPYPSLQTQARTLQYTTLSFDVSFQEIGCTLSAGACLFLIKDETRRNSADLIRFIEAHRIERLFMPYVALADLCETSVQKGVVPSALRAVFTAGEQLRITPAIVQFFESTGASLHNHYGPTESHVVSAFDLCKDVSLWPVLPSIGRAIANTQLYVLDKRGNLAPIGVPGELYIGGIGLARGYLNRPELTAEKFIPDPFSKVPGARLYKTGDLVRYCADGNIEFLGRLDHQVKIRGFRIELGEIESALVANPEIREAVVVALKEEIGGQRLVAYLVAAGEPTPSVAELCAFLKTTLPEYMVPAAFVFLSSLPLTPNGKVDRRALPEPTLSVQAGGTEEPKDAVEEILAGLWATVLRVPTPGRDGSFFELGGHSLLATQLASRIRDALGVDVPVRWLFEAPTVEELATRVRPILAGKPTVEDTSELLDRTIVPVPRDRPLLLSFAQQRLWFLDQLEGPSATYNMPGVLQLSGALDLEALRAALSEIVRRHESLRTCLVAQNGEPVQEIQPALPLTVSLRDLRGSEDPERETKRLVLEEALLPFDLARDLPIRAGLLQRKDNAWSLLLTLHHSTADGWSISTFIRELVALYAAFRLGQPSPLSELAIQYADFAVWQRAYLTGERFTRQVEVWRKRLVGSPECLNLPTDRPRPPKQSYRGAAVHFTVESELTGRVQALGQRSGSTLFMTLLAAWANLLARYSGAEDLVIGSPVANRTQSAIEPLIGFFVNTLALRADLSGNPSFLELLTRVRQVCLEAYAHQEIPFESLVEALSLTRNLSHAPLFQVMFVLQNNPEAVLELPGLEIALGQSESTVAKFDLTLSIAPVDGVFAGTLEYASDLFDRETIERMGRHFVQLLRSIVTQPERSIGELDVLPAAERQQLLTDWNAMGERSPSTPLRAGEEMESCVQELFEAQVLRTPEATAVVYEEEELSYAELNRRANQLAHALMRLGVGPDDRVAIGLKRSHGMVIALLAVLKAGGAYVPLDPGYPAERLNFMLEDSGAKVLLTHESLRTQWPHVKIDILCLDTSWTAIDTESEVNPQHRTTPSKLAYVIYTSGSTGKPKGVAVEHQSIVHHCKAIREHFDLTPNDRVLQFASLSFDASVEQIFPTLCAGARIVLPEHGLSSPEALDRVLGRYQVSVAHFPPAFFEQWILQDGFNLKDTSLRLLQVGGDAFQSHLVRIWGAAVRSSRSNIRLLNGYGPTEVTVTATFHEVPETLSGPLVPIGRPLPQRSVYVLDGHLQLVPIGVPGELYIGGVGVARGYLNRPELSAEKFIPNPFSKVPGERLYKTGDLVRYRPDGNLEFLGRLDHQVKIRGFRIELGEIEAALVASPTIREAVVVARKDGSGGQRLVAYLVAEKRSEEREAGSEKGSHQSKDSEQPTIAELRAFLRMTLPEYMVPSAFVFLATLPLTPNGKVDRKALPEPGKFSGQDSYLAPRDALEQQLVQIGEELLSVSPLGIEDNFFEKGGHSLMAVRLVAEIEKRVGRRIPVSRVFEFPTIAELASLLRKDGERDDVSCLVRIRSRGVRSPIFFLPGAGGQVGYLYSLARLIDPEIPFYAFQSQGMEGKAEPFTDMDTMAAHFVSLLREVQPEGPYNLAGHSTGGLVAYAMAQHLLNCGERIGLLMIVDTFAPGALSIPEEEKDDVQLLIQLIKQEIDLSLEELEGIEADQQFAEVAHRLREAKLLPEGFGTERLRLFLKICRANTKIHIRYSPEAYQPLPITLIRASEAMAAQPEDFAPGEDLGWNRYSSEPVAIHYVPGDHGTMMLTPHVTDLAQLVEKMIG